MITRKELIKKYLEFFESKAHKAIPSAPLIPENDPTTLFISAGMQPLVPYLLGQKHPLGKRLVNVQKCIRTGDIDEVGNATHHTFFEMLGNWSLGDYFKKETIEMSFEFLTKVLKIPKEKINVTCFAGENNLPKDIESANIWKSLGIKKIKFLGKEDNWWGPVGNTGPCGPDTEIFMGGIEIWNDVFMQYNKDKRIIFVDGMNCLYDKNFNLNKELLEIVNSFNTHTVLTVNGFREKGHDLIKNYDSTRDTNWKAFSLEEKGIKKDNPEYFKELIKRFNFIPEEIIYFDHDKKNVEIAKKLGILSQQYTNPKSIKKFIENNLWVFIPLKQKNVDTGMGVERTIAILNGLKDNYETEVWAPIIKQIEKISGKKYKGNEKAMRIIADHIKAAVFIIVDGVSPSNTEQGYVLRRLVRRAVRYGKELGIKNFTKEVAEPVFEIYSDYKELKENKKKILKELEQEEKRFLETLEKGMKVFQNLTQGKKNLSGKEAFLLYQSYGFPLEMIEEETKNRKIKFKKSDFEQKQKKHQELSRTSTKGKFTAGLEDNSEKTTKYHTATHLLHKALKIILGEEVKQMGSNITQERLRFDFKHDSKLTNEEKKKVEDLVNEQIKKSLPVSFKEMPYTEAIKTGALSYFRERYPNIVKVYIVGSFSKEICTGPHVKNTKELGKFKITKEESVSAGVRRIKAVLE